MKFRVKLLSLLLLLPIGALGQESDEDFNRLVDEVLELTGALAVGEQMSQFMVAQLTQALRSGNTELPDVAYDLLEEEVNSVISENMRSGSFQSLMYPIYAEHLSQGDLEAMVAFYKTPEGRRIAEATPIMSEQGMLAGQAWGESLGAEVASRVLERLSEEGFELR